MRTIAALYVDPKGCYAGLPGVELWDEERDARLYPGPHPVVAHPPCGRWCQLAHIVEKRYGYKVGDDAGAFESALAAVRRWGGVLEHPAFSLAWPAHGLPRPTRAGWTNDLWGGWVCEVSQAAYGHPARKLTWLYAKLRCPPVMDWRRPRPTATIDGPYYTGNGERTLTVSHQVSFCANHGDSALPRLSKKAASATPPAFRDVLIAMARGATTPRRAQP